EAFAVFDLEIEPLLHARRARVAEDRAVAERARPELHAALHPADCLAVRQRTRGGLDQIAVTEPRELCARRAQPALDVVLRESGAEIGAVHAVARAPGVALTVLEDVVGGQCGSHRAAGIARRRLDPDAVEDAFLQQLAVG